MTSAGKGQQLNFESDENSAMELYTYAQKVKDRAMEMGVGTYDRPRLETDHESIFQGTRAGQLFDGRLPVVIRKLSLDQLSALYSLFSNWYGYLATQTTLISAERSEAIRQREFMLNHLKNYYRRMDDSGKKIPETAISDAAKTDLRFISKNAAYEELNALYDILSAMLNVADQDMRVISREVTIQQEKSRKEFLGNNFGNRESSLDTGYYDQPRRKVEPPEIVPDDDEIPASNNRAASKAAPPKLGFPRSFAGPSRPVTPKTVR